MRYLIFIALLLIIDLHCKKIELPIIMDPQQASPIFEMKAEVAGKPVTWTAGLNNVVLNTSFTSSPLEVLVLEGTLRDKGCATTCKQSLQIKLRYRASEFLRDTSKNILPGRLIFFKGNPDSLQLKTKNNSVLANSSNGKYTYLWSINEIKYSDKESIAFNIKPQNKSKICLTIVHPDKSTASQCQSLDYSSIDSFPGLKVSIMPVQAANKNWSITAKINGIGPFKYFWDNKSTDPTTEIDTKAASYQCLTVYDVRGNTASACIDLQPEGKVKSRADFDFILSDPNVLKDFIQYNTAEMIYIDESGQSWSTANPQRQSAHFEVLQVSPYIENEVKQATRKIKISFDADFYNANRSSIAIKGTGTMAVAYPR